MQAKHSPVFQIFESQHLQAKELFLSLGKQIKSKKAIELATKMDFLEVYAELLNKIHFDVKDLNFELFSQFKNLQKSLHKIHHFKLVEKSLNERELAYDITYGSYRKNLTEYKKDLYTKAFDLIVGSPLKSWDDFFDKANKYSQNIKPLAINTAINQVIEEELEYFTMDSKGAMDTKLLKDTFIGLRILVMLENMRIHLGFNPIFVPKIHAEIEELKNNLKPWYVNHLNYQSLSYFASEREDLSKKYMDWLKDLKAEKKILTALSEKRARKLFEKILG